MSAYIEAGLETVTEHTITRPDRLVSELGQIREQGYALNREESIPGIGGIAVPVRTQLGEYVGALSLAPMIDELTQENIERWLPQLRVTTRTLTGVITSEVGARLREARKAGTFLVTPPDASDSV